MWPSFLQPVCAALHTGQTPTTPLQFMCNRNSCHHQCVEDSQFTSALNSLKNAFANFDLSSGAPTMSGQDSQRSCWHATRASWRRCIGVQGHLKTVCDACRVWQKQSRQVSLTGTCLTPHSVWKSMSIMSRWRTVT